VLVQQEDENFHLCDHSYVQLKKIRGLRAARIMVEENDGLNSLVEIWEDRVLACLPNKLLIGIGRY
jgi:hypothetical protein